MTAIARRLRRRSPPRTERHKTAIENGAAPHGARGCHSSPRSGNSAPVGVTRNAPAGVLVASTPPWGIVGSCLRAMKRHPWNTRITTAGEALRGLNTPQLVRESLFSPTTPESDVKRYAARLEEERRARVMLDLMMLDRPQPKSVTTRLLVLGAEYDGICTPKGVRATARAYRTEAEIFPDMGHDMMLEPGWAAVAARIHCWLGTRDL
jgi:pimeloyl-ACP methyl ester carboxylesterase